MNNTNNKQKFRAALDKKRVTITEVAARLGITTASLYNKLDGKYDWKLSECDILYSELGLQTTKVEGGYKFE